MSSLAHEATYGDEKLYFYSFCFVCCIIVKLLVNAVEKRIGGSCCQKSTDFGLVPPLLVEGRVLFGRSPTALNMFG